MLPVSPPVPSLEVLPSTVEEMAVWEPFALYQFLAAEKLFAHRAAQQVSQEQANDMFNGVLYVSKVLLRNWDVRRSVDTGMFRDAMPAELAAQILVCVGWERLGDLHRLGRWYAGSWTTPDMVRSLDFIRDRHRAGRTSALLQRVHESTLPNTFVDDWWAAKLAVEDLRLGFEAGLSDTELQQMLASGVVPDRVTLQVMVSLSV